MTAIDKFKQPVLDAKWKKANIPDGYTVVTVGDIIVEHPILEQMRRKPDCQKILEWLGQADLVVGNFEGTIVDLPHFDGWAEAQSGFGWLISDPECAHDLKTMGFDMLSRANNHALDWGTKGMHMTDDVLRKEGFAIAGTGSSMSAARSPAYHHGAKARASLVSFTSTFEPNAPAGDALGQTGARPGANTLGTTAVALVSQANFEALKKVRDSLQPGTLPPIMVDMDDKHGVVSLFGKTYKAYPSGTPDTLQGQSYYTMDDKDLANILLNLRQAKQASDYCVLAAHAHEPSNWINTPPNFLPDLAHRAIDECGVDMVACHGPHQLRGIEIYKGKPIFYSLANFAFMENVRGVLPREEWERRVWKLLGNIPDLNPATMTAAEFMEWQRVNGIFEDSLWFESVITRTTHTGDGQASAIEILPIELHWQGRDAERGLPRYATGSTGLQILRRLAKLSAAMNTTITLEKDEIGNYIGFITLPVSTAH